MFTQYPLKCTTSIKSSKKSAQGDMSALGNCTSHCNVVIQSDVTGNGSNGEITAGQDSTVQTYYNIDWCGHGISKFSRAHFIIPYIKTTSREH